MAGIQIRKYRDDDDEAVKEIFTLGMSEHVPSSFMHILKQPPTQMVLMCMFCALLTSSKSFLLPILAVTFCRFDFMTVMIAFHIHSAKICSKISVSFYSIQTTHTDTHIFSVPLTLE
uniref:N-acetyltransferase domain-containing protein n=1 Tax=Lates calcarifer TaxID=8187 RepID=A0A4W6DMQ3_LATCA